MDTGGQEDWPLCLHPSAQPQIPHCPCLRFLLSVTWATSLAPGQELPQALLHGGSIPEWVWCNVFTFQKWFAGHSSYCLTPVSHSPCPIVHIFYSFAKKMAIFLNWRDKSKNLLPETKVNFFVLFFLPLFVMLAPRQFTVFYFLSSVCVNFYIIFFTQLQRKRISQP